MTSQSSLIRLTSCLCLFLLLAACGASQSTKPDNQDIYSSLRDDTVQYQGQNQQQSGLSPEVIQEKVTDIRNLYFRKKLDEAQNQAERLLRMGSVPEAYYWLARINLDQANYQQAYDTASKGLSVTSDANLKKALERLQSEAQMGNL